MLMQIHIAKFISTYQDLFNNNFLFFKWCQSEETCLDKISEIIGAERDEVVLMNTLTVNIHFLFTAFYKPSKTRNKILLESHAFPSDHYAIESQIRLKGYRTEDAMICLQPRQVFLDKIN